MPTDPAAWTVLQPCLWMQNQYTSYQTSHHTLKEACLKYLGSDSKQSYVINWPIKLSTVSCSSGNMQQLNIFQPQHVCIKFVLHIICCIASVMIFLF